jgi:hypothetical protein
MAIAAGVGLFALLGATIREHPHPLRSVTT